MYFIIVLVELFGRYLNSDRLMIQQLVGLAKKIS